MRLALTRELSRSIVDCELSFMAREPIDFERAVRQHRRYEERLEELGCQIQRLSAEPELPDAVFVEDCAVVLDEIAVITRPGAPSRRPERAAIAAWLEDKRRLVAIKAPATLDGGDVLVVDRTLFVGMSERSNAAALDQLKAFLSPYGYNVIGVPIRHCLHLKSSVTQVAAGLLLINRERVDTGDFRGLDLIDVDPAEPDGANALLLGRALIYPGAFPRTRQRLEERGIRVLPVDLSELAKAEGGVTCCSLVFEI